MFKKVDKEMMPVPVTTTWPYSIAIESKREGWKPSDLIKEGYRMKKLGGDMGMRLKIAEGKLTTLMGLIEKKSPGLKRYIEEKI